ncbi:MAG: MFS transporter [Aliidongia sp.]
MNNLLSATSVSTAHTSNRSTADGNADFAAAFDRLSITPTHWLVLAFCAMGLILDTGELAVGQSFAASVSGAASGTALFAWLLASAYLGGVAGAPIFGWIADRKGRVLSLSIQLGVMGVASIGATLSRDLIWIAAFRTISGLALGGFSPVAFTYLTELLPSRSRGGAFLATTSLAFIGPPATLFLIRCLTPIDGAEAWRPVLLGEAILALLLAVVALRLPESPRWLLSVGPQQGCGKDGKPFQTGPAAGGER